MKRTLALTLAALLISSTLAGCQSAGTPPANDSQASSGSAGQEAPSAGGDKTKFSIMGWGDPNDIQLYIDGAFTAYPELKDRYEPEILIAGKGDGDVYAKVRLALTAADDLPDIFQANRTGISEFIQAGVLEDLTAAYEPYKSNVNPAALELVSSDGKYFGFPYEIKTKLWFYRQDIFSEVGVDASQVKTMDDFIAAGKKIQEKYPESYIWDMGNDGVGYNLGMVLSGNGAKIIDDQGNYVVDTDPGVRTAFESFKKLKDSGVVMNIAGWTPDWEQAYANGSLVSTPCGNWLKFFIPKYAPELSGKWAVAQFPEIGGAVGGSEAGGSLFCVPKDAKNKDAAVEVFSKLWLTKEGNFGFRAQPGREAFTPICVDALADPAVMAPDAYFGESLMKEEVEAMNTYKVFDYSPAADLEFTILNQHLAEYLAGSVSLDDALSTAQKDLKNQIGNPLEK